MEGVRKTTISGLQCTTSSQDTVEEGEGQGMVVERGLGWLGGLGSVGRASSKYSRESISASHAGQLEGLRGTALHAPLFTSNTFSINMIRPPPPLGSEAEEGRSRHKLILLAALPKALCIQSEDKGLYGDGMSWRW